MQKGRGTQLTPLGANLLWAGQRARQRLAPELENLASEFAHALNHSLSDTVRGLCIHASHDFAIARLRDLTAESGLALDVQYRGSFDALAALRRGECDVAGFHIPDGELGPLMARRYAECLPRGGLPPGPLRHPAAGFHRAPPATRRRSAASPISRAPTCAWSTASAARARARCSSSCSRAEAIDRSRIRGYDIEEVTHAAVAALIAGKQADVGFGVKAAAAQYRLDFVACCTERYYLACREDALDTPPMRALLDTLRSPAFRDLIASLPGYARERIRRNPDGFRPPRTIAHDGVRPMKRRTLLQAALAAPVLLSAPRWATAQQLPFNPKPAGWRTFEVASRVEVMKPTGASIVWIPLPSVESDYQDVLGNVWTGNAAERRSRHRRQVRREDAARRIRPPARRRPGSR